MSARTLRLRLSTARRSLRGAGRDLDRLAVGLRVDAAVERTNLARGDCLHRLAELGDDRGPARPAPELDHVRTHHRVRQLQQRAAVNFRRCGVLRIVRGHEPAFPRVCGAPMNDGSENIRPVASRWTHPRHRRGRTASRPANVPSQLAPGRRKRRDEERATANSRSAADRVSTHSIWCSRPPPAVCPSAARRRWIRRSRWTAPSRWRSLASLGIAIGLASSLSSPQARRAGRSVPIFVQRVELQTRPARRQRWSLPNRATTVAVDRRVTQVPSNGDASWDQLETPAKYEPVDVHVIVRVGRSGRRWVPTSWEPASPRAKDDYAGDLAHHLTAGARRGSRG
jgi:hypothetical protein